MICGYPGKRISEAGEYEMKEISFALPPSGLRDIAQFLTEAANALDTEVPHPSDHYHIETFIRDWRMRYPNLDLVVVDPRRCL